MPFCILLHTSAVSHKYIFIASLSLWQQHIMIYVISLSLFPEKSLTNVCSDKQYTQTLGYLSSPSFPEMYPANMNCTCTLSAAPSGQVKLDSPFFLLKAGTPCQDWVQITTETGQATKCGYIPEQRPVVGQHLTVNFHSDKRNTEMGFWFKFSGRKWVGCNRDPRHQRALNQSCLDIDIMRSVGSITNSSPPGQYDRHFVNTRFRCILANEKVCILIKISLKFVTKGPIDNNPALV